MWQITSTQREKSPASDATCLKCKKRGHYASESKSKIVHLVDEEIQSGTSDKDCYFFGTVESNESQTKWSVNLLLGKAKMCFKIIQSHSRALALPNQNGQSPQILTRTVWTWPV